jgi:thiol-disulfide isomerase/thioredoxin
MTTQSSESADRRRGPTRPAVLGELPSLPGATGWLNSQPLTPEDLRGRVVVVNFWTYTCINWLRQLPYLRAWVSKYSEQGLLVVGVHTPEFGFEARTGNVARAVRDLGIEYPVAIDSNYAIWTAFGNRYWPALYFSDADGRLRQRHFGEGECERSEQVIQQLLSGRVHPIQRPGWSRSTRGAPKRLRTGTTCDPLRPTWATHAPKVSRHPAESQRKRPTRTRFHQS